MTCVKPWMTVLCCGLAVATLVGCDFNPRLLFSRTRLPAYEFDFTGDSMSAAAAMGPSCTVDEAPMGREQDREWRYIVIHHSATSAGNAEIFDRAHRKRGWDELGYHFVIGNGRGAPDGSVEVGGRWLRQKCGAHCGGTGGNEYNEKGIGICLVGNFNGRLPSPAQLAALNELVEKLSATYHIPSEHIISHREAPKARTKCPGDALHSYVTGTLRGGAYGRPAGD